MIAIIDRPDLAKEIVGQVSGPMKIQINKMLDLKEEQKLLRQTLSDEVAKIHEDEHLRSSLRLSFNKQEKD